MLLIFGLNVKLFIIWGMKGKDRKKNNCGSEQKKGHQIVHGPVLCPCFAYNKI